jgi:uncharacterized protein
LSSYGGFWLSYAVIQIPGFNVVAAYGGDAEELRAAIAFYLFGWFIFTFLMLLAVLRHSVAFIFLFVTLDMAFLMLALSEYFHNTGLQKAGGVFGEFPVLQGNVECRMSMLTRVIGLLAAFTAWYCAIAQMLTKDNSHFTLPVRFYIFI